MRWSTFRITPWTPYLSPLLCLALFVMLASNVCAQNTSVIDSIQNELNVAKSDLDKANLNNALSLEYIPVDSTKAIKFAVKALEFSRKENYGKGISVAWYQMGTAYRIRGYYNEARIWFNKSKALSDSLNLQKEYAQNLMGLGGIHNLKGEQDTALILYKEAEAIYKKENDLEGQALVFTELGILVKDQGQFDKAIDYYEKALSLNLSLDKKQNVAKNYNNLANVYAVLGDFGNAAEYYLESISLAIELGDKNAEAVGYSNIGQVYVQLGDNNQALEYYTKGIELSKEIGNTVEIALIKVKIGSAYLYSGNPSQALPYFEESLIIAKDLDDKRLIANAYNSIGDVYYRTDDAANAIKYFKLTEALYKELGDKRQLSHLLIYMGDVYRRDDQLAEARKHLDEGVKIGKEINYAIAKRDGMQLLAYVEYSLGNHKEAFEAHVDYKDFLDTLRSDETTKRIDRLKAEFEFEVERDSIAYVQERTNLAYEEELSRKKLMIQGAIGSSALVFVILILLYRSYLLKQRKNSELELKNAEISSLHEKEQKMAFETIALKERELTTVTMLSHEKNSLLEQLGDQIGQLSAKVDENVISDLKEIKRTINTNLSQKTWSMFMYQFEKVHPNYFKKLKTLYPSLTQNDLRLSAYIKVGMGNKEIAQISSVTNVAVKKSINRMKKRMELASDTDLRNHLIHI